jgi:hypothetical protein
MPEVKAKYPKRFTDKETQEYEFRAAKMQERDFGATLMTLSQLEKAVKRAQRRSARADQSNSKTEMYKMQVDEYQKRIEWYLD